MGTLQSMSTEATLARLRQPQAVHACQRQRVKLLDYNMTATHYLPCGSRLEHGSKSSAHDMMRTISPDVLCERITTCITIFRKNSKTWKFVSVIVIEFRKKRKIGNDFCLNCMCSLGPPSPKTIRITKK
eukprot:5809136-Amphidinium_carterae.1